MNVSDTLAAWRTRRRAIDECSIGFVPTLAALALAAPVFQTPYILIANKTSDAIAVTVNPQWPPSLWSFRSDDRPTLSALRRFSGSDAEESEIETPGVGNPRGTERSRHMLGHHKSFRTRDIRPSPSIGFENALKGVRVTGRGTLNEQRIHRN